MGKDIVIPKGVVIPRQSQLKTFTPGTNTHWFLGRLMDNFYLRRLGFVMKPVSNKFRLYSLYIDDYIGHTYDSEDIPNIVVSRHELLIATETELSIKKDVTFERFFKSLRRPTQGDLFIPSKEVLSIPDDDCSYYCGLEGLFDVLPQDRFAKELSEVLDSSPDAESKVLSIPMVDEQANQQIELEFVVTKLFGLTFVRLSRIIYEGASLEYLIEGQGDRNVYRPDSENLVPLKSRYVAFTWDSEYELYACHRLISKLVLAKSSWEGSEYYMRRFVGDIALNVHVETFRYGRKEPRINTKFDVLEPDYTVFVEREV